MQKLKIIALFLLLAVAIQTLISSVAAVTAASPEPSATPTASPKAKPRTSPSPSPSVSPSPTPIATSSTTQKLRERIERVVDQKRDRVQGALDDLANKKRGFIGEIQRVSAESITVTSRRGTQVIPVTDVEIVRKGQRVNVDTISVGDWVVVLGTVQDETFTADKVIVAGTSLKPADTTISLGTIKSVTKTEVVITNRVDQQDKTFLLVKATSMQDADGNKLTTKDLTTDLQVLVIGQQNKDGKFEAKVIKTLATGTTTR